VQSLRPRFMVPRMRFRVWMIMVVVAVSAGMMAEMRQRPERLSQLCRAHRDIAYRNGASHCGHGLKIPRSIEEDQMASYHWYLADEYEKAANQPWFPLFLVLPPFDGFRDIGALAEWGLETALQAVPFFGILVLILIIRSETMKSVRWHV
jgi:hypothetical protein